jgi:hypothetical protein
MMVVEKLECGGLGEGRRLRKTRKKKGIGSPTDVPPPLETWGY